MSCRHVGHLRGPSLRFLWRLFFLGHKFGLAFRQEITRADFKALRHPDPLLFNISIIAPARHHHVAPHCHIPLWLPLPVTSGNYKPFHLHSSERQIWRTGAFRMQCVLPGRGCGWVDVDGQVLGCCGYLSPLFALAVLPPDVLVNQHKEQTVTPPFPRSQCPFSIFHSPFPRAIVIHHRRTWHCWLMAKQAA